METYFFRFLGFNHSHRILGAPGLRKVIGQLGRVAFMLGCCLLLSGLAAGCKPKPSVPPGNAGGYFQTPSQSECEYIVRSIVSDLAEEIYYAANHRLPDEKTFTVAIVEKPEISADMPVYEVQIDVGPSQVKQDVVINGPIWSPVVYQDLTRHLAQAFSLSPRKTLGVDDTALLAKLTDGLSETIEKENQRLSAALESDFTNPTLHEQAALLLGVFMLRDHSGKFFEIRSPLSRLTVHLAMASFLRGSQSAGINGQLAEVMMATLVENQADAVKLLNGISTNNAVVLPVCRVLLARNTGDYRPLEQAGVLSPIEEVEHFFARANYVSTTLVWPDLTRRQRKTIDYVRIANFLGASVEVGHELLAASIPLETQEIESIYALSHQKELSRRDFVKALNELPDGCFARMGTDVHVHIIGWGQWAHFLQRHLCHAVRENFRFMNRMWGVPDEAKEFAANCEQSFRGLRLYPFVSRFNCTDVQGYHKAVDDAFKVTVATPHLVPAECWNYLCYKVDFAPKYDPNPNPHINEWHSHNPPPGTVYDLYPRLNHPSLVSRADVMPRFEQLHEMAPYDCRIINVLWEHKYNNQLTYEQATNLFQPLLPYSLYAMRSVANTVYKQPDRYRELMLKAAALDPVCYYDLGDYEIDRHDDDLGAKYIDQACAADPDSVRVSNHSYWRVQYYLRKGQIKKAREIADEAGEVYSAVGLEAKASFFEKTTNYDDALEWYAKLEERYDNSGPVIDFCQRYKRLTGDTRFDSQLNKRLKKVFPTGMEKVSIRDFQGSPADGVSIQQQNNLLTSAGLRAGDVIVAIDGIRTHTFRQYMLVRDSLTNAEMNLIVWQGSGYHEVKASPPNHKFGVDFGDYRPQ